MPKTLVFPFSINSFIGLLLECLYLFISDTINGQLNSSVGTALSLSERHTFPQGANDPRVNKNESDQMVEALRKRGVEVQYMVKDNEGHGFHIEENQYDFYGAMGEFFEKHLSK